MAETGAYLAGAKPTMRAISKPSSMLNRFLGRTSTIAFFMTLPLMFVMATLVIYPAFYSVRLAMLDRPMVNFVGLANFSFLVFKKPTFWIVVYNSVLFAVSFVIVKAFIGFVIAHLLQNLPAKAQRRWRAALLIPWVIPPAMSVLAWLWLFDPSFGALNWVLKTFGIGPVFWLGDVIWARSAVIIVSVWIGAPFFMVIYLAALKSVPEQLYEAAEIDGATWWQKLRFVTLPMTRNIIAITMLFSLIVASGAFTVIQILTNGGPHNQTDTLATWAFRVGMLGGDIPLGASTSLFTLPILALAAIFILRNVRERGSEA